MLEMGNDNIHDPHTMAITTKRNRYLFSLILHCLINSPEKKRNQGINNTCEK